MKSAPALPPAVRTAAESALAGEPLSEEFAWMSWAGTVWRLTGKEGSIFVKRAADLGPEKARLDWLERAWPVPHVIALLHDYGDDWLLTRAVDGVPMYDPSLGWPPDRVSRTFGEILKSLHAADASDCPFGEKKRGHVLVHGDYCLPNVLVSGGELSAVVDVGLAGLASPEVDLAAGVWTLQYNYGKGQARTFLEAYGWPPMSDEAIEKLRRKYAR